MIIRLFAFGALLYVLFVQMCPAMEAAEPRRGGYAMRAAIALLVVLVGIALAVVTYFFLATPAGPGYGNPWILDGPTLFLISILLIVSSAIARELITGSKSG